MFAPGTILVADRSASGGTGAVIAINPANGAQQMVSSGGSFANPSGVVVEPGGTLLVLDTDAFGGVGGVIRVNPSNGAQTALSVGSLLINPFSADLESDGTIVVASANGARVARVDPANGIQRKVLPLEVFESAVDVAIDLDGSILVIVNVERGGELVRVDRVTEKHKAVPGALFHNPIGIAVASDGILWVVEDRHGVGPSVVRFDTATQQRTTVSARGLLRGPFRIALEAGDTVVVTDPDVGGGTGRLIRVNRVTGTQSILAQDGFLVEPFGVAVVR